MEKLSFKEVKRLTHGQPDKLSDWAIPAPGHCWLVPIPLVQLIACVIFRKDALSSLNGSPVIPLLAASYLADTFSRL